MSGETTGALGLAGRRRWIVHTEYGGFRLVDGEAELRDLVRRQQVTFRSRLYEVSSASRTVADVLAVARLLPREAESEPPIRQAHVVEPRSPERVKLSEELAVLNRPLEDEVEYYDEVPRSRAKRVFAAMAVLAALAGGGYVFLAHRAGNAAAAARLLSRLGERAAPISAAAAPVAASPEAQPGGPTPGNSAEAEPEADPPLPPTAAGGKSAALPEGKPPLPPRPRMPRQVLLAAADRALEDGRTHRAEELYREALADHPGDAAAATGLAYIHLDRGRIAQAVSAFKQALARDEGYPPALFGLGEAYREQGRRDLAIHAFKAYLARDPSGRDSGAARRQIEQLSP